MPSDFIERGSNPRTSSLGPSGAEPTRLQLNARTSKQKGNCKLADLDAEEFNSVDQGLWTRGLLIRRRIADDDLAFFSTWCPAGTSIETLVAVEGHRWAIEDSFETAKNEFGLDHNESRSWHGWHRHVSLVMLAFAMMAAIRHRANPTPPKKTKRRHAAKAKTKPPN